MFGIYNDRCKLQAVLIVAFGEVRLRNCTLLFWCNLCYYCKLLLM
jgi:hypothetical protein